MWCTYRYSSSQSAPTILVLKNGVGLGTWKKLGRFADLKKTGTVFRPEKTGCQKTGSGFFLLFKKRRGSLASSLLDCKLQTEKIWSRPWKKSGWCNLIFFKVPEPKRYQVHLMFLISGCRLTGRVWYSGLPAIRVVHKPSFLSNW